MQQRKAARATRTSPTSTATRGRGCAAQGRGTRGVRPDAASAAAARQRSGRRAGRPPAPRATRAHGSSPPAPSLAHARQVTFETQLADYGGDGAYVVLYVTDRAGRYQGTLWMAGRQTKYYRHLRDWYRATGGSARLDGITGASVGAGRTLRATLDVADALLDAGYEIHIDTAVEDMNENASEVVVPLNAAGAGKAVKGRGYVKSFRYSL